MKPYATNTSAIRVISSFVLIFIFLEVACWGQPAASPAWALLEAGFEQKSSGQRVAAVRVLGLIPDDPRAAGLAEEALQDPSVQVRAAAATALGQMHAAGADPLLKDALNDKHLPVVLAAAHALCLLKDSAGYAVYYEFLTGERKDDSSMISQELKVFRDPKQVAQMGFSEGIGFVPFAGIPWEAVQTIMKDKKGGIAAKAALIAALGPDPDVRANEVLLRATENANWPLRVAALEAIAKRGDPALATGIESRLSDSRREVKYTAAAAIVHLNDLAAARATTKTALLLATPVPETTVVPTVLAATQAEK